MTNYIMGMSQHVKETHKDYIESFQTDHFGNVTMDTEDKLINTVSGEVRNKWSELNESTNTTHSSRKA